MNRTEESGAQDTTQSDLFQPDRMFFYREKEKIRTGLILISAMTALFIVAAVLLILGETSPAAKQGPFFQAAQAISDAIRRGDSWGIAFIAFTGGLFFLFIPLEVLFLGYLNMGLSPLLLFALFFGMQIPAQTLNYAIGFRIRRLSRFLISARKFYRMKGLVNHYGPVAIFVINALPLPSPVLSAVLGAFRYRISRFYFYTLAGQLALYGLLVLLNRFKEGIFPQ